MNEPPKTDDIGQRDTLEEDSAASLEQGDFYYEGPYLVFTAAYHLKRGYCCNSGCRHCPYQDESHSC